MIARCLAVLLASVFVLANLALACPPTKMLAPKSDRDAYGKGGVMDRCATALSATEQFVTRLNNMLKEHPNYRALSSRQRKQLAKILQRCLYLLKDPGRARENLPRASRMLQAKINDFRKSRVFYPITMTGPSTHIGYRPTSILLGNGDERFLLRERDVNDLSGSLAGRELLRHVFEVADGLYLTDGDFMAAHEVLRLLLGSSGSALSRGPLLYDKKIEEIRKTAIEETENAGAWPDFLDCLRQLEGATKPVYADIGGGFGHALRAAKLQTPHLTTYNVDMKDWVHSGLLKEGEIRDVLQDGGQDLFHPELEPVYVPARACDFSLPENADVITCVDSLIFEDRPLEALANIYNHLKLGGHAFVTMLKREGGNPREKMKIIQNGQEVFAKEEFIRSMRGLGIQFVDRGNTNGILIHRQSPQNLVFNADRVGVNKIQGLHPLVGYLVPPNKPVFSLVAPEHTPKTQQIPLANPAAPVIIPAQIPLETLARVSNERLRHFLQTLWEFYATPIKPRAASEIVPQEKMVQYLRGADADYSQFIFDGKRVSTREALRQVMAAQAGTDFVLLNLAGPVPSIWPVCPSRDEIEKNIPTNPTICSREALLNLLGPMGRREVKLDDSPLPAWKALSEVVASMQENFLVEEESHKGSLCWAKISSPQSLLRTKISKEDLRVLVEQIIAHEREDQEPFRENSGATYKNILERLSSDGAEFYRVKGNARSFTPLSFYRAVPVNGEGGYEASVEVSGGGLMTFRGCMDISNAWEGPPVDIDKKFKPLLKTGETVLRAIAKRMDMALEEVIERLAEGYVLWPWIDPDDSRGYTLLLIDYYGDQIRIQPANPDWLKLMGVAPPDPALVLQILDDSAAPFGWDSLTRIPNAFPRNPIRKVRGWHAPLEDMHAPELVEYLLSQYFQVKHTIAWQGYRGAKYEYDDFLKIHLARVLDAMAQTPHMRGEFIERCRQAYRDLASIPWSEDKSQSAAIMARMESLVMQLRNALLDIRRQEMASVVILAEGQPGYLIHDKWETLRKTINAAETSL